MNCLFTYLYSDTVELLVCPATSFALPLRKSCLFYFFLVKKHFDAEKDWICVYVIVYYYAVI